MHTLLAPAIEKPLFLPPDPATNGVCAWLHFVSYGGKKSFHSGIYGARLGALVHIKTLVVMQKEGLIHDTGENEKKAERDACKRQ